MKKVFKILLGIIAIYILSIFVFSITNILLGKKPNYEIIFNNLEIEGLPNKSMKKIIKYPDYWNNIFALDNDKTIYHIDLDSKKVEKRFSLEYIDLNNPIDFVSNAENFIILDNEKEKSVLYFVDVRWKKSSREYDKIKLFESQEKFDNILYISGSEVGNGDEKYYYWNIVLKKENGEIKTFSIKSKDQKEWIKSDEFYTILDDKKEIIKSQNLFDKIEKINLEKRFDNIYLSKYTSWPTPPTGASVAAFNNNKNIISIYNYCFFNNSCRRVESKWFQKIDFEKENIIFNKDVNIKDMVYDHYMKIATLKNKKGLFIGEKVPTNYARILGYVNEISENIILIPFMPFYGRQ